MRALFLFRIVHYLFFYIYKKKKFFTNNGKLNLFLVRGTRQPQEEVVPPLDTAGAVLKNRRYNETALPIKRKILYSAFLLEIYCLHRIFQRVTFY